MNPTGQNRASKLWPVPGASICVVDGSRVLLVKRAKESGFGLWSLPGGHIEPGEAARDAALRELREETGIEARITCLLDIVDVMKRRDDGELEFHYVVSVFGATSQGGKPHAAGDVSEAGWFAAHQLDRLQMTPGTADLIKGWLPFLGPGAAVAEN